MILCTYWHFMCLHPPPKYIDGVRLSLNIYIYKYIYIYLVFKEICMGAIYIYIKSKFDISHRT